MHDKGHLFSLKKGGGRQLLPAAAPRALERRYSQTPLTGTQRKVMRQGAQVAANELPMRRKEKLLL